MQAKIPVRIVIYAKDVMNITGRRYRSALKLLACIRKKYKMKKTAVISIKEFCAYTGLDQEMVREFLK